MIITREPLDLTVEVEGENGEPDRVVKATITGDAAMAVRCLLYELHRQIAELQTRLITEGVDLEES